MARRRSKWHFRVAADSFGRHARDTGFTLIEVLVALTVLSLSLGVLFGIFSQGLARTQETERETGARMLAQSLLAENTASPPQSIGETDGMTDTGLGWRLKIAPYPQHDDQNAQLHATIVSATIEWQGSGGSRSLTLTTLRLVGKAPT
jgi:general secretion pathway protein I